ncbi:hypothetical protein BGZ83_009990, partial [Gryganskiella cystojenkinii]
MNLVCNARIVDNIICTTKSPSVYPKSALQEPQEVLQTPFEATNNGGAHVYIVMDKPCSKDLPPLCAAAIEMAREEEVERKLESASNAAKGTDDDAEDEVDDHADADTDMGADEDTVSHTNDTDLWFKKHPHKHGKHHRHRLRHSSHHHNKTHHHNKYSRHKKNKHPYKDFCVAVGEFCGDDLFGCNFDFKTRYLCKAVGEKPIVVQRNAGSCGGTDGGTCNCRSTAPVCGSRLLPECRADPNAIYHCPRGNGTKYEVYDICSPGTQCNTGKDDNAYCGSATCSNGNPEFVSSCGQDRICMTVSDEAICRDKGCKCEVDGTKCGKTFDPSCGLLASGLYNCKKDETPVLIKDCWPSRCVSTTASMDSSVVFETDNAKDNCVDPCTCISKGKVGYQLVCGSTFPVSCGLNMMVLYNCDRYGAKPVQIEECAKACVVHRGDNSCAGPCECLISRSGKPVCGGSLDPQCNADPTAIYHCHDGAGSDPKILRKCLPGTKCITDKDGNANCGYSTCNCTGSVIACSEQYPTECKFVPNSVYKCAANGVPTLAKTCPNAEECVSVTDGAFCASEDCKCPVNGKVGGDMFPISCRLAASTIYSCNKGETPVVYKECEQGTTRSSQVAKLQAGVAVVSDDQCINDCLCVRKGKACGSTFSLKCNLKTNSIYQCNGAGTVPKPLELCPDQCIVQAGGAVCPDSGNKCKCPISSSGKLVCGGSLDSQCNADSTAIYHCPDGAGADPKIFKKCLPGTQCNTVRDGNANCGYSTCNCTGSAIACSEQYPTECKFVPNSVYKCAASGVPELAKTCSSAEECVSVVDDSFCANKDCKGPIDGQVCGDMFPISCRLSASTIYDSKKGEDLVKFKDCAPGICSNKIGIVQAAAVFSNNECNCIDNCKCVGNGKICGSTWSVKCKLDSERIYQCDSAGTVPKLLELCPDKCIVQAGGAVCSNADNKCKCPISKSGNPVCGGSLYPLCNAEPTAIYHCPDGAGADPKIFKKCLPGTQCITDKDDSANCGYSTCNCTGRAIACSEQYPTECKLVPNSVYRCAASGLPDLVQTCSSVDECVSIVNGSFCASKDCKCPADGDICGDMFPISCRLAASTIYSCKNGEDPVAFQVCEPGTTCSSKVATLQAAAVISDDQCINDCMCVGKGKVCGSTFSSKCKFETKNIYQCDGAGTVPKPLELCSDKCIVQAGGAICSSEPLDCNCKNAFDTCGSAFGPACNLSKTKLYTCTATGAAPTPGVDCISGCVDNGVSASDTCQPPPPDCSCKNAFDTCGSVFDPACNLTKTQLYTCTSAGAAPTPGVNCTSGCLDKGISASDTCQPLPPDCSCKKTLDTCGSTFDPACNLTKTQLYTCTSAGASPTPGVNCTSGCFDNGISASDKCQSPPPDCSCKNALDTCGSTFDPACNMVATKLYTCTAVGATAIPGEDCVKGCANNAASADTCNLNCDCTKAFDTCGAAFDPACNMVPDKLYICPAGVGVPALGVDCSYGCEDNGLYASDTCRSKAPLCKCKKASDTCGSTFHTSCKLVATKLYTCTAPGAAPTPGADCTNGCVDNGVSASDTCQPTPPDCSCKNALDTCGSVFDPACNMVKTKLYS